MKCLIRIISLLFFIFNITLAQATTIICIAGGTGAGKTNVAKRLKEELGDQAEILSQDSYYKSLSHLQKKERKKVNFDHPDAIEFSLFREHLLRLKKGESVEVPTYDFSENNRTNVVNRISPTEVIIIEGILLLAIPEIRDLANIKVFVDVPDDIRLLRRIKRDIKERGREISHIQEQYLKTVKPMHQAFVAPNRKFADIIIPHGSENHVALELLTTQLKKILATTSKKSYIYTSN